MVPAFDKLYPGKSEVKAKFTTWAESFGLDLQFVIGESLLTGNLKPTLLQLP